MKKINRRSTAILLSLIISGMMTACGSNTDIGRDEAKRIALEDAGMSESEVTRITVSKESDDGKLRYDVEFTNADAEYDYEILASNGEIISSKIEKNNSVPTPSNRADADNNSQTQTSADDNNPAQSDSGDNNPAQSNPGSTQLTLEEAKKLALDKVPGASDQNIAIELELDDGYYIYEGEIIYNQTEYEFEIDAYTGTFLEWSMEQIYFHHDENNGHDNHDTHDNHH